MKNLLLLTVFCAFAFPKANAQGSQADINDIKAKYVNWLLGEGADYSNAQVTSRYNKFISAGTAAMDLSAYDFANPGPVWDFSLNADKLAYFALVEQKLIRLVYLYQIKGPIGSPNPNYHSVIVRDKIISLFNYMKAKGINGSTNFMYVVDAGIQSIETSGNGVALRSSAYAASVLLMKDDLVAAGEFANHLAALNGVTYFMSPEFNAFTLTEPGFNTDVVRASIQQRLCYVLAQDDTTSSRIANMDYLKFFLNNALKISNGWRDCIKPDFITFHHKSAYSNTYGSDALHQVAILNLMLDDTEWELDVIAKSNIKEAIMTYNKFSKGFEMPRSLGGRFPFNTDALNQLRPALAYLYLADPIINEDAGREFIRLWNISTTANTNLINSNSVSINLLHTLGGMKDMLQVLNVGLIPLPERLEGQFNFPYAGLSVHKYNGYQASVKGTSKHIWTYENGTNENRFGRYTSAGSMEILTVGNPLTHATNGYVENGWDWSRTPGVTAAYLPLSVLSTGTHRLFNGKNMLAHASFDNNGVFVMDYKDANSATTMTALKSVFFFNDKILCIGSNINNATGTYPIQTTLFQTALSDVNAPTYVNGTTATGTSFTQSQTGGGFWATDAVGNGYVVPVDAANFESITVQRSVQNSRDESDTADTTGNFTTAYINHGVAPTGTSKYAYGIMMQGGQTGTQEFANNFASYFKIWHQNSEAHIVQYIPDFTFAYTIFNPLTVFAYDVVKKVDKPAVVITQKTNGGDNLKVSLTNSTLGLLTSAESYTYNQINASASIINRAPQIELVTLTLIGHWTLVSPMSNVIATINGADTDVTFSTINGATIQTELVKTVLDASSFTAQTNDFKVIVAPNPTKTEFKINVTGDSVETIFINIFDVSGRKIDFLKANPSQTITIGGELIAGIYLVEITQGKNKKTVKLIKQ